MSFQWQGSLDPNYTAEQLAQLAADRPDLWAAIAAHPNSYEALRQWIAERQSEAAQAAQAAQPAQALHTVQPVQAVPVAQAPGAAPTTTAPSVPLVAAVAQGSGPANTRGKATAVLATVLASALVLAGGATALALTGTFDRWFGGASHVVGAGGLSTVGATDEEAPTFANGMELMWTLQSDDLVDELIQRDGTVTSMFMDRYSRAASPAMFESDRPAATTSAVIMTPWAVDSKIVMADASSGAIWLSRDLGKDSARCVADTISKVESFYCVLQASSQQSETKILRIDADADAAVTEFIVSGGYSRAQVTPEGIILAGGTGDAMMLDRDHEVLWQSSGARNDPFMGIDASNGLTLIRGTGGWSLFDDAGQEIAWAKVVSPYEGGSGACDARLTRGGALVVSDERESCVNAVADFRWVSAGENLFGIDIFSSNGIDYLVDSTNGGVDILKIVEKSGKFAVEPFLHGDKFWGASTGADGLVVLSIDYTLVSFSLDDGTKLAEMTTDVMHLSSGSGTPEAEVAKIIVGDGVVLLGNTGVDARTGEALWRVQDFPGAYAWEQTPAGILAYGGDCPECSIGGGALSSSTVSLYAPAGSGGELVTQRESSFDENVAFAVAEKPSGVPDCPTGTLLLAWAEVPDGWVLVCGYSVGRPAYVAYKLPGGKQIEYSAGWNNPSGSEAGSAVRWDPALNQYLATLANGNILTLDYDMATATIHDRSGEKVLGQHRTVRYIFVPLGQTVRTVSDASGEEGAFSVTTPKDTAEDQVRYMVEVLEKAYEGRALVKEALPKLQNCTASAGGYGDTVQAMETVRDNRAELLSALSSMPVDKIPEGQSLLDDLRESIQVSHTANVEYVKWANDANARGCGSLSSAGQAAVNASDAPKERFAARWNRVVVPAYGVRSFDPWFI